jgi:hypothetical protein
MTRFRRTAVALVAACSLVAFSTAWAGQAAPAKTRIYSDHAHGELPLPPPYDALAAKLGVEFVQHKTPITAEGLKGYRLLMLRAPSQEITADEAKAIIDFVTQGGSLVLIQDEERRQKLEVTKANDVLAPFGLRLTGDTPYRHNTGGLAKKGAINAADREIPYSGGRAVEGGTPFAWQLDADGKPAQPFASYTVVGSRGRVVVMGEGMASIFLGFPEGVRLSPQPADGQTVYWGKDSAIFMEELLTWLIG